MFNFIVYLGIEKFNLLQNVLISIFKVYEEHYLMIQNVPDIIPKHVIFIGGLKSTISCSISIDECLFI